MIVETKNSTYEIQGNWIRKIAGDFSSHLGEDFVLFTGLVDKPEVGKSLMVLFGQRWMRTSTVVAIVAEAKNEED